MHRNTPLSNADTHSPAAVSDDEEKEEEVIVIDSDSEDRKDPRIERVDLDADASGLTTEEQEAMLDAFQVTPEHIRGNGGIHSSPYAGIAEIVDNAIDSGATEIRIEYKKMPPKAPTGNYILINDNGAGMNRVEALNTLALGHSTKRLDANTIGQFGNGLKSGSMRLGETLLLCTKKSNQKGSEFVPMYTVLLISMRYMEYSSMNKCLVPCVTFEVKEGQWKKQAFAADRPEKHDYALEQILKYTPFTEFDELKEHMLKHMPGKAGTSVLIADLRIVDGMHELQVKTDTKDWLARPPRIEKDEQDNKMKPNEQHVSDFLAELYIKSKATIYLQNMKINTIDPIRSLADPRSSSLSKADVARLAAKQTDNIKKEKMKLTIEMKEKRDALEQLVCYFSHARSNTPEFMERRREQRMKNKEIEDLENKRKILDDQQEANKADQEVKIHVGIDLLDREPRVLFYTNGRRICTESLLPKKFSRAKFLEMMGVVCVIDIPSTLMSTSTSREGYADSSEVQLILNRMKDLAKRYFELADVKYKSAAFWTSLGYEEEPVLEDVPTPDGIERAKMLVGIRRQCANCREFRSVVPENERAVKGLINSLDVPDVPFVCRKDPSTNECEQKSREELRAEQVKELPLTGVVTKYEDEKKKKVYPIRGGDHEDTPPPRRLTQPSSSFTDLMARAQANTTTSTERPSAAYAAAWITDLPPARTSAPRATTASRAASSRRSRPSPSPPPRQDTRTADPPSPRAAYAKRTRQSIKYEAQDSDDSDAPARARKRKNAPKPAKKQVVERQPSSSSSEDEANYSADEDATDDQSHVAVFRRRESPSRNWMARRAEESLILHKESKKFLVDELLDSRHKVAELEYRLQVLGELIQEGNSQELKLITNDLGALKADHPGEILRCIVKRHEKN